MLDFFTDAIDSVISDTVDVTGDLLYGEAPSRQKVAKLISAGLSIAAVASALGVAEEVVREIIDDD